MAGRSRSLSEGDFQGDRTRFPVEQGEERAVRVGAAARRTSTITTPLRYGSFSVLLEEGSDEEEGLDKEERVTRSVDSALGSSVSGTSSSRTSLRSATALSAVSIPEEDVDSEDWIEVDQKAPPVPRTILILGDGNFSFSEAFCKRRMAGIGAREPKEGDPLFAKRLIVTEYKSEGSCSEVPQALQRVEELRRLGARVEFGIDATKIADHYRGRSFKRIQWNCPDMGKPMFHRECSAELSATIHTFFLQASQLQKPGDKVHINLISPPETRQFEFRQQTHKHFQGLHYRIVEALRDTGYDLVAIKTTGQDRYSLVQEDPESDVRKQLTYTHQKTKGLERVTFSEHLHEYIFVKLEPGTEPSARVASVRGRISANRAEEAGPAEADLDEAAGPAEAVRARQDFVPFEGQYFIHPEVYEEFSDEEDF